MLGLIIVLALLLDAGVHVKGDQQTGQTKNDDQTNRQIRGKPLKHIAICVFPLRFFHVFSPLPHEVRGV